MTSERSLLAIAGDATAESTGSYPDIITAPTSLGIVWILDLPQHPAPQPGHWNTYSLGLRSESQAQQLHKQGNRYLLQAISSLLARIQAQPAPEAVASAVLVFQVAA